jgi:hypothetical protein
MFDSLFCDPDTKWVVISRAVGHHAPNTGILAFAYPEETYGYSTHLEITESEVPKLVDYLVQKGMTLNSADESVARYCYPGAKWWTDFPQSMKSTPKCQPEATE